MTGDLFQDAFVTEMRKQTMIQARDGKGAHCPCCDQFVKVYRRSINRTMARQLIFSSNEFGDEWFHARDVVLGQASAGDYSKLRFWGLIEKKPHEEGYNGKKSSGYWRVTPNGHKFARFELTLPQYALVYNNNVLEFEGDQVNIVECLGDRFDYNKLMERDYETA